MSFLFRGALFWILTASTALAQFSPPSKPLPIPDFGGAQADGPNLGPELDEHAFWKKRASVKLPFRQFSQLASFLFSFDNVWIYTDTKELAQTNVESVHPLELYKPTWGEFFVSIARQMRCDVVWDNNLNQWHFVPRKEGAESMFTLQIAQDWRSESRGRYMWYAPTNAPMGMDVYVFGPFWHADEPGTATAAQLRNHYAELSLENHPERPKADDMRVIPVAGFDSVFFECEANRGIRWRQWCFFAESHVFLIVSAIDPQNVETLPPQVDAMIASFRVNKYVKPDGPTTRPSTTRRVPTTFPARPSPAEPTSTRTVPTTRSNN